MPRAWQSAISRSRSAERAEERVDVAVVGDVVAEVGHRRGEDRGEPDRLDPQRRQVVEPRADARAGRRRRRRRRRRTSADRSGRSAPRCHHGRPLVHGQRCVRLSSRRPGVEQLDLARVEHQLDLLVRASPCSPRRGARRSAWPSPPWRGRSSMPGVLGQLVELVGLVPARPRRRSRRRARSPSTRRPSTWARNFSPVAASGSTRASSKCSGRMPAMTSATCRSPPSGLEQPSRRAARRRTAA